MKDIKSEVEHNLESNELNKSISSNSSRISDDQHAETDEDRISREHRARLAAQSREQRNQQLKIQNDSQQTQKINDETNKQTKKKKITKGLILLIVVLVVIACSVLFTVLSRRDKSNVKQVNADVKPKVVTEDKDTKEPEKITKSNGTKNNNKTFKEPTIIDINADKWYLTCVNRDYGIKSTYKPKLKKLTISSKDPRQTVKAKSQSMDYRAAEQYQKMYNAAAKEGIYLTPYSGYRSIEFQKRIFDNHVRINRDKGYSLNEAKFKASEIVLLPGTSEHNLGLAIDIVNTNKDFEDSKEYKWLDKHAQDYGFILRYQKNKTNVTNITYEPWHWRYVGVKDAQKIKERGCCLEEYLNIK